MDIAFGILSVCFVVLLCGAIACLRGWRFALDKWRYWQGKFDERRGFNEQWKSHCENLQAEFEKQDELLSTVEEVKVKLADLTGANREWRGHAAELQKANDELLSTIEEQKSEIHRLTQLRAADGLALFRIQNVLDDNNTEHSIQITDDQRETD